jgi:hypothetical protein
MKITETDLAIECCKEDFFLSLKLSCEQAGGTVRFTGKTTLDEIANTLAQNGIRFIYCKSLSCTDIPPKILLKKAMQKLNS